MQGFKPDLTTEITLDGSENIIVKIKNIGKTGLKESDYQAGNQLIFMELIVGGKATKINLTNVDPQKVLMRPGRKIQFNTGQKVWENPADIKTEVVVKIDPFNQIQETNKLRIVMES